MTGETKTYHGSCYCGAVEVTVTGDPVVEGYCHCLSCRKWHAAPVNAWSAWPKDQVTITGQVTGSDKDPASRRITCTVCGGCVANEKPQMGLVAVYPMTLFGSAYAFKPTLHIFYDEGVLAMSDGLSKFVDAPEAFGGSGDLAAEPEQTGWR